MTLTEEQRTEPLPAEMYSQTVAIRLTRHAAWFLIASRWKAYDRNTSDAVTIVLACQIEASRMNLGDFARIKAFGNPAGFVFNPNGHIEIP